MMGDVSGWKWKKAWLAALTVALVAPACVCAAPDGVTEAAVKRYFLARADARCHVLTPETAMAVGAGYVQARNASIRQTGSMASLAPWLEQARAAADTVRCDAPQLLAVAGQAEDAYRSFVTRMRLDLPGNTASWTGIRTYGQTTQWRLAQYQSTPSAEAALGLYGPLADARFVVMARFSDGARPYSARLLVRNPEVATTGVINTAPRDVTTTAPVGFTPGATLSFMARNSADVDVLLKPKLNSNQAGLSVMGGYVGTNDTVSAVRFDLPTAAWRAMAALDPREDVVVAFDCRDGTRYMRFETGDFLTGLSFIRLPSPWNETSG